MFLETTSCSQSHPADLLGTCHHELCAKLEEERHAFAHCLADLSGPQTFREFIVVPSFVAVAVERDGC